GAGTGDQRLAGVVVEEPFDVVAELHGQLLVRERVVGPTPVDEDGLLELVAVDGARGEDGRELAGEDRLAALVGDDLDAGHERAALRIAGQLVGEVPQPESEPAAAEER